MDVVESLNEACRARVVAISSCKAFGFEIMFRDFIPAADNPYLVAIWLAWRRGEERGKHIHYAFFVGDERPYKYERGTKFIIPSSSQVLPSETEDEVIQKVILTRDFMLRFLEKNYGTETTN